MTSIFIFTAGSAEAGANLEVMMHWYIIATGEYCE